jgi:hypothetical protein
MNANFLNKVEATIHKNEKIQAEINKLLNKEISEDRFRLEVSQIMYSHTN